MWPTPSSQEAGRIKLDQIEGEAKPNQRLYSKKTGKHMQVTLGRAVALWPTPCTRDYKGGRKLETLKAAGRDEKNSLPDAVNVANQETGSLNPAWVEWLMGFPDGWTDLNNSATR
jgi:hypothetical protein|tara:strand:+ start:184 stop:528 length:345 start_codon:yes stop_codon:yes gene_type:complete